MFPSCSHWTRSFAIALLLSSPALSVEGPTLATEEDLPSKVWELRGEHQPLTEERFQPVREELRRRAATLEKVLDATNTPERWRDYLKWDLIEPHLGDDPKINRNSLSDIDKVLRRFRSNMPGLELKSFRNMASTLQRYRELAFWYALAKQRDSAPIYDSFVKRLQQQVERHLEEPTVETERGISKTLATIDHLDHAPELVSKLRSQYSGANFRAEISIDAMNRLVKPICELEPVRDCILGASVRGQALANGTVRFAAHESSDQMRFDIHMAGHIATNTVGYKKPVKIYTTGSTNYTGFKTLTIKDDQFSASPAYISAQTTNRPRAVKKTGGNFGRKLIEKIAWKKVCEKKRQSERIASAKAKKKLTKKFDQRVANALTEGRAKYVSKLQLPMQRRGFEGELVQFQSAANSVLASMKLSTDFQLSADSSPPVRAVSNDITLQLHQSAVNNFLPFILSGVQLQQDSSEEAMSLKGDLPPWLKKISQENKLREITPANEAARPPEEDFKPYRLTFNGEHPASVSFDDNRVTIRLRFEELKTGENEEEPPLQNWDFIIHYRLTQRDNQVVLVRDGEIEVFPTGFDPRWDERMSSEQVGYRNNMAKNLNKKADEGRGFPKEIEIPALKIASDDDAEREFALEQLECDEGWLTVGYRVP